MKKIMLVLIIMIFATSSTHALFDSKKIKELEDENATLKSENIALKAENKKMKNYLLDLKEKLESIKTLIKEAKQQYEKESINVKDKVEIVQENYNYSDSHLYSNVKVKNNSKFSVRAMIVVEVHGSGDQSGFIYKEFNIYETIAPGETKNLKGDSLLFKDNINSIPTYKARIEEVVID
jgi:sugar-specific transcriptional regulator TrmB